MSNEEKILELLQGMTTRLDRLESKVDKLECKVDQQKTELQAEIKASESRMMALMEGYFEPKFNLLADGQKLIQEKMLPMEALDIVEDRLDVLEAAVKLHSREIKELKKAQ